MFLAVDEFQNTQSANNNAYCQDSKISWLNWECLEKNQETFLFFQKMIQFRKEHPVIRKTIASSDLGLPSVSMHGVRPWNPDCNYDSKCMGVLFAGKKDDLTEDVVYVLINSFWEKLEAELPHIGGPYAWKEAINTYEITKPNQKSNKISSKTVVLEPRSVSIYILEK